MIFYCRSVGKGSATGLKVDTLYPDCRTLLIERRGYTIPKNSLKDGACPTCRTTIPGVWN